MGVQIPPGGGDGWVSHRGTHVDVLAPAIDVIATFPPHDFVAWTKLAAAAIVSRPWRAGRSCQARLGGVTDLGGAGIEVDGFGPAARQARLWGVDAGRRRCTGRVFASCGAK